MTIFSGKTYVKDTHKKSKMDFYKCGYSVTSGMTLYQFNQLDEMEQAEAMWESTLVGQREDEQNKISLYSLDDFYVEGYYNKETGELVKFRSFKSIEQLQPYLQEINLDELLKGRKEK